MKHLLRTCTLGLSSLLLLSSNVFAATELPQLVSDTVAIQKEVAGKVKQQKQMSVDDQSKITTAFVKYLSFLGLDAKHLKELRANLNRLMNSSTQFILCDDWNDWACLEKSPLVVPTSDWRKDTSPRLGEAVAAGSSLSIEYLFTKHYDIQNQTAMSQPLSVASKLTEKINGDAQKGLYMAVYGLDDIGPKDAQGLGTTGSLASVYNAIIGKKRRNVDVKGVFDTEMLRTYDVQMRQGTNPLVTALRQPLIFSYVIPTTGPEADKYKEFGIFGRPAWMDQVMEYPTRMKPTHADMAGQGAAFAQDAIEFISAKKVGAWAVEEKKLASRFHFQYQDTLHLIRELNQGIRSDAEARARVEFPSDSIMHNKFLVMKNASDQWSVWSGTANVSKTCMGTENNANMSIYIKNNAIATAFYGEMQEMFNYDLKKTLKNKAGTFLAKGASSDDFSLGRFHNAKRPNTNRYFTFTDGTEVRVHFSPTDDGEHRVILPMLLSAQAGDEIRVAMFGGGGLELVRAFQYAAAKGANIRIALDGITGFAAESWMKAKFAKLSDSNPYIGKVGANITPGTIKVRTEKWKGLLHHKTATLTRKTASGMRAEVLVIGSQNWTSKGNDVNDENMVTIRNRRNAVAAAEAFNQHFDAILWPANRTLVFGEGQNATVQTTAAAE